MPFKIIAEIPETGFECEHHHQDDMPYGSLCEHPNRTSAYCGNDPLNGNYTPKAHRPIRNGWPRYYMRLPAGFPENYTPQPLEEGELEQARRERKG